MTPALHLMHRQIEMLEGDDHFIMWTKEKMIVEKILEVVNADSIELK